MSTNDETAKDGTVIDRLVSCKACGAVFNRSNAPSRMCPVCQNDGVEHDRRSMLGTKKSWYEAVEA